MTGVYYIHGLRFIFMLKDLQLSSTQTLRLKFNGDKAASPNLMKAVLTSISRKTHHSHALLVLPSILHTSPSTLTFSRPPSLLPRDY